MIPKPHTPPAWLPLRLILASAAMSCGILAWEHVPSAEWSRFLAGLTVVGADGTTLASAMSSRVGATLMLVIAALLMAVTTGLAVSFTALKMRLGLPWLVGFAGRLLAALPVVAIGWVAVGWIVGENGWPLESLLPHHPAPGEDTWGLSMGRRLWWWLVPCWVLTIPLTGEFISQTLDLFNKMRRGDLINGLRSRGLKRSLIHYHHIFPTVWPDMLDVIQSLGLLALGYVVFVEEALGIPGWGSFFAAAIKSGDARGIAGSIYTAGWMSATWCLCVSVLRHLTTHPKELRRVPDKPSKVASAKAISTAASLVFVVLACCSWGEMPALSNAATLLGGYVSPLVSDLRMVAAACAMALSLAVIRGGTPAWSGRSGLPRAGVIETLSWSPLLVWLLGISAVLRQPEFDWIAPGIAVAFGGAVRIRNRWSELHSSRAIEGSRAVGTGKIRAWRMHVLPELFRLSLSWILQVAATLMVWVALIDSLKAPKAGVSPASLGIAMAAAKENVLSDRMPMIVPALIVAISALFFNQLSRIVRPGPPPH